MKPETAAPEGDTQAAELAALEIEAANEAPPPGSPEPEPEPAPVDLAAELSGLLLTVSAVLKPALPSLAEIYTPEACQQAGAAVAAVCNKRGWLQGGVLGGYGEEVAAVAILGPMAVATYQGVRADLERMKRANKKPDPAPVSPGETPAEPRQDFAVTIGPVAPVGDDANQ